MILKVLAIKAYYLEKCVVFLSLRYRNKRTGNSENLIRRLTHSQRATVIAVISKVIGIVYFLFLY